MCCQILSFFQSEKLEPQIGLFLTIHVSWPVCSEDLICEVLVSCRTSSRRVRFRAGLDRSRLVVPKVVMSCRLTGAAVRFQRLSLFCCSNLLAVSKLCSVPTAIAK